MSGLVEDAREVLDRAFEVYRAEPADDETVWALSVLTDARSRLDEPLRVALAGTLKSGKSTLLNAMVGEQVAATDAGECTRIVTWYHDAPGTSVVREEPDGRRVEVPYSHGVDGLTIDPTAVGEPEDGTRLLVGWPSESLRAITLIDTPGLDSARKENSERTLTFVTPDDRPSGADVVVYLMRQAHPSDVRFLEAFADLADGGAGGLGGVGAAATVVVLARADEVGSGRLDALARAGAVAEAYAADPLLRPLCQSVVAVDGLLGETARTLRQSEFTALRALAGARRDAVDAMLLSVDRFTATALPPTVADSLDDADHARLDARSRARLLARLGLYGLRVATTTLRGSGSGPADAPVDSVALAQALMHASGVEVLREVLRTRVTERADVYKARSALLAVSMVLDRVPRGAAATLALELERVLVGAHEFAEQRHCAALRRGLVGMPAERVAEAERLLGGQGPEPVQRLGLADGDDWGPVATDALVDWRARAESPMTSRAVAEVSRAVVRSLEALLAPSVTPSRRRRRLLV